MAKNAKKKRVDRRVAKASESVGPFPGMLEPAPDAMLVVDSSGKIVLVNTQTERLFGYSRGELLGRGVELLVPERFREQHRLHRTHFFVEPRVHPTRAQLQLFGLRKDGTEFPVEVSFSPTKTSEGVLVTSAIRDVTERTMAEEYRLRLAAIVESSEDAIISKNLEGVITSWNASARRIFGYKEHDVIGQPIYILIPPELWDEEKRILERLRAGAHIEHFETIRVTKTGKRVNVSLTISPIRDSTGTIAGFSKIARDISDRKRAEEALRASEERLKLAQQVARIGTFELNIRTGVNTWTPELETIYGLPPGSFGGTQSAFEDLVHSDDRTRVVELVRGALKTGQPTKGEWRVILPDGSVRWIAGRWQAFVNESGEPSRMIGVNADITEGKLAEEALRESEERFRLAAEAGNMYSFEWDVTTDEVVRSSERNRVLGVTEPLRSTHQQFVKRIHPDDRQTFISTIAGLTPEHPTGNVIYRVLTIDGAFVWLRSSGRAIFDGEGKMLRVIGMVADITDLKRAEHALADMTRKLVDAQEQERARIARELHDDIGQRLALLTVELDQLQAGRAKMSSTARARIRELQKQMQELSVDVQSLSHDLHPSKLEHLGVVAGIKAWCREFATRQKIEIDFSTDVSTVLPLDVGVSLFRVLQEALHNAAKHSGAKRVTVELRETLNEIQLVVRDLGTGFDVKTALGGKGLGLSSMKERVRLVNGTISIESKPMKGTAIQVRVPVESKYGPQQAAS
jgi:PAS domain S-box-containing protein